MSAGVEWALSETAVASQPGSPLGVYLLINDGARRVRSKTVLLHTGRLHCNGLAARRGTVRFSAGKLVAYASMSGGVDCRSQLRKGSGGDIVLRGNGL